MTALTGILRDKMGKLRSFGVNPIPFVGFSVPRRDALDHSAQEVILIGTLYSVWEGFGCVNNVDIKGPDFENSLHCGSAVRIRGSKEFCQCFLDITCARNCPCSLRGRSNAADDPHQDFRSVYRGHSADRRCGAYSHSDTNGYAHGNLGPGPDSGTLSNCCTEPETRAGDDSGS